MDLLDLLENEKKPDIDIEDWKEKLKKDLIDCNDYDTAPFITREQEFEIGSRALVDAIYELVEKPFNKEILEKNDNVKVMRSFSELKSITFEKIAEDLYSVEITVPGMLAGFRDSKVNDTYSINVIIDTKIGRKENAEDLTESFLEEYREDEKHFAERRGYSGVHYAVSIIIDNYKEISEIDLRDKNKILEFVNTEEWNVIN